MKHLKLLSSLLVSFLFVSCEYNTEVRKVAEDFFDALKVSDTNKVTRLYPAIGNLSSVYKTNGITIQTIKPLPDDKYEVVLLNHLSETRDIETTLFIQPYNQDDAKEGYYIYDSVGLLYLENNPAYELGMRMGHFSKVENTDQNIAFLLKTSTSIILEMQKVLLELYLRENVVVDWNWENSYGSASGSGVITNNTKFTIPDLAYVITYYKRDGTEVTKDAGRLYTELRPSGSESFSFYTFHVGNASKAEVTLNFDQDFLITTAARYDF